MVADPAIRAISVDEYLALEADSEIKHEYVNDPWLYQRYEADATVTLETIGLSCPVARFYRRTAVR